MLKRNTKAETGKDKPDVPKPVLELAEKIGEQLKIGEGGVAEVPEDYYSSHLPEGVTMEQVQRIQNHDKAFYAATGLALGEAGLKYMEANTGASKVSVNYEVGSNQASLVFYRTLETADPKNAGKTLTDHGVLQGSYTVRGSTSGRDAFNRVAKHLANLGRQAAEG